MAATSAIVPRAGWFSPIAWGSAGQYTMLAQVGGQDGRLAGNALASAQVWLATIIGPAAAGVLLARIAPGWLLGFDAATFAFLAAQAWRTPTDSAPTEQPVDARAPDSGLRLLRRNDLLGLIVLTWLFFFLYGPVEDALPVYVVHDLHAHAGVLGAYWTSFGVGALVSTLLAGTLRSRATRRITLVIIAGWGACLIPFAFAPAAVTLVCFAFGGLVYGPFTALTYAHFQSITTTTNLPRVLAARSAALIVAAPLGLTIGGPLIASLGARGTLAASGGATVLLAALATAVWRPGRGRTPAQWRSTDLHAGSAAKRNAPAQQALASRRDTTSGRPVAIAMRDCARNQLDTLRFADRA